MNKFVLVVIAFLVGSHSVYSQRVFITRETFASSYTAANEKAREFTRRHDSQLIQLRNGRVEDSLTWKWEYASEDKSRLRFEQKGREVLIAFEMISLGEKTFCQIGNGEWVQAAGVCPVKAFWMGTQMSRMMAANASSEFSMEVVKVEGQNLREYKEVGKFGRRKLPSGNEALPSSYDSTFWVDVEGRIVRQEYKHTVTESKLVTATWVDTFTYVTNLNVVAPIR